MLDGAVKTIMVDDSKTVGELLVTICSRIGTSYLCFLVLPILSVLQICWICAEPLWTHTQEKNNLSMWNPFPPISDGNPFFPQALQTTRNTLWSRRRWRRRRRMAWVPWRKTEHFCETRGRWKSWKPSFTQTMTVSSRKKMKTQVFPIFFIFFKVKSFTRNMLYMESGSLVAHVHSSLRYLPAFTGMWEY